MTTYHVRVRIIETHDLAIIADDPAEAMLKVESLSATQIRDALHHGDKSFSYKIQVRFSKPSIHNFHRKQS